MINESFRWISPLGLSVILFFIIGALWIIIGLLAVPLHKRANPDYLFVSSPADNAYYGSPSAQLAPPGSPLAKFRSMMITILSGFLILGGIFVVSTAWFGLKQANIWALVTLAVAVFLAVCYWGLALLPYYRAGVRVGLGDMPPFIWVPALLIIPAVILGWIGLR